MRRPSATHVLLSLIAIFLGILCLHGSTDNLVPSAHAASEPAGAYLLGCYKSSEFVSCEWKPVRVDSNGVLFVSK